MKYKVISNFRAYPFENYSEALLFKTNNGGTIYELVWHQKF